MKSPVPSLVNIFLHRIGIRINRLRIEEVYSRHPMPHSIRSLSDTLDELQVVNMVCRLEFEQLFEIGSPFIVAAGKDEYPFFLVELLDKATQTISLRAQNGKQYSLSFDQFQVLWDGTVLMAEKGENTQEDERATYYLKQGLAFIDRTWGYWLIATVALVLLFAVADSWVWSDLRYLMKVSGVAISLLVVVKTSSNSRLAQRFCLLGKHANCNAVFQSAGSKLFGWVSLGELSLTYFAASLLLGAFSFKSSTAVFLILDALALPFIGYSLVWQIRHKQWCTLCLAIDAVLLVDFLCEILLWNTNPATWQFELLVFCLLFMGGLLVARKSVRMAADNSKIPHLQFKHEQLLNSSGLFWKLLAQQPEETTDSNSIHAVCNYVEAAHTITIVMNPSCPKCARIHKVLGTLDGYRINLVFAVNEGDRTSYEAALRMISSGITSKWDETIQIIAKWYDQHMLPIGLKIHPCAISDMVMQTAYCRDLKIEGTPTILLDNRRLPEIYDIEDLRLLL